MAKDKVVVGGNQSGIPIRFKDMGDNTFAQVIVTNIVTLPLPTGASTEATLAAMKTNTNRLIGANGGIIISDTTLHSNLNCFAIYAKTDIVIASLTLAVGYTGTLPAGSTMKQGETMLIGFAAIQLTSGTAILYNN